MSRCSETNRPPRRSRDVASPPVDDSHDTARSARPARLRAALWCLAGLAFVAALGGAFAFWHIIHAPAGAATLAPVPAAVLAAAALACVLAAAAAAVVLRSVLAPDDADELVEPDARSRAASAWLTARLLDSTSETLVVLDRDAVILTINETGARRLGHSPREIIGRSVFDLLPEDVARSRRERVEQVLRTGDTQVFVDTRVGRINENTVAPFRDETGAIVGVTVFARDVTEAHRAEEELRRSEARYRAVVEASPLGIAVVNFENERIIQANESLCRMLGYEAHELEQQTVADITHPEDREQDRQGRAAAEAGDREPRSYEKRYLRKDGSVVWGALTYVVMENPEGRPTSVLGFILDITERKRVEKKLEDRHAELEEIFEAIPDALVYADLDRRITKVNPAFTRLYGYQPEEVLGRKTQILYASELDFDKHGRERYNLQSRRVHEIYEVDYRRKDGSTFPSENVGTPVCNAAGEPIGFLGIIRDISARKRAEHELRDHLRFLETLLDVIPSAIFYKDHEGVYRGCNQVCCEWLGWPRDAIVGKTVHDLYPRELADKYREMDDQLFTHPGRQMYEFRLPHADGSEREVLFQKATYLDSEGRMAGLVGVATDIAALKNAERALTRERQRFFSVLEAIPAVVYLQAPDRTIRFANQEFHRRFGDPAGRLCYEVLRGRSEPCEPCPTLEVLETGTPQTWEWTSPEGRTYAIHDVPFSDVDGAPLVLEMGIDITDRKRAEKERLELEEQLRHAQKLEAIGTLSAGVAHDFNNALMAVLGHAETARLAWPDRDRIDRALEGILAAANQAAGVTRSLLTFSRKATPRTVRVHLGRVVNEALRMLQRMLPAAVELTVDAPTTGPLWMEGDAVQLNQVLMNLVLNARDAMPEGGTLRIAVEGVDGGGAKEPASDGESGAAGQVRLAVQDTGAGMTQEVLDRVCDPFFTTKTREQGTGLGMAVVHGIVESHQGRMRITSAPGQGTTVTLEFPGSLPPDSDPSPRPTIVRATEPATILLAEDDEHAHAVTVAALEAAGHQVVATRDGEQALARFEEKPDAIDLAVLDVDLPRLGGVACLERLRAARSRLPVILVSGFFEAPAEIRKHEGVRFLRKPYPLADLVRLVSDLLVEARSERAVPDRPA